MDQTEQQTILDLSQQETVDASQLPVGTPIKIGKNVVWFEDTATEISTWDELAYWIKQYPNRPYIIFSPKFKKYPEYAELISNYIINNTHLALEQPATVRRVVSDETLNLLTQHSDKVNEFAMDELLILQRRDKALCQLDTLEAEFAELDAKMRHNNLTQEEYVRGEELCQNLIPVCKNQIVEINNELAELIAKRNKQFKETRLVNNDTAQEPSASSVGMDTLSNAEPVSATVSQPTESITASTSVSNEQTSTLNQVTVVSDKQSIPDLTPQVPNDVQCCQVTPNWNDSRLYWMPLSMAVQMADSPGYRQYKEQQTDCNGYKAVPLQYLLMYRIDLYLDGLPIVFTDNGEFMRIGNSNHDPLDMSYWYPKPYNL